MISTGTTTINSTDYKNTILFKKETVGIEPSNFLSFELKEKFAGGIHGIFDFVSSQEKVLVELTTSFYHLYHDQIGEFLYQYEKTPNAKFLINITSIEHMNPLPEYIKFFFKFLNDNNIDYQPIDLKKNNKININNFYYRNYGSESLEINGPSPRIYEMSQRYVKDKSAIADKKIFLSRKNFQDRDLSLLLKGRLPHQNDNRIDDEAKLQEYVKTLGFEIVVPEDFKTFEDQINYLYKAKTIMSTTSSGLTNACFMRPGSTIIELTTPLIAFTSFGDGVLSKPSSAVEEIHHFYHLLASSLGHKYMSIPNRDRSVDKVIDFIEKDPAVKNFLLQ